MSVSRRTLFGLFAGAAVTPFLPKPPADVFGFGPGVVSGPSIVMDASDDGEVWREVWRGPAGPQTIVVPKRAEHQYWRLEMDPGPAPEIQVGGGRDSESYWSVNPDQEKPAWLGYRFEDAVDVQEFVVRPA